MYEDEEPSISENIKIDMSKVKNALEEGYIVITQDISRGYLEMRVTPNNISNGNLKLTMEMLQQYNRDYAKNFPGDSAPKPVMDQAIQ